MLSEVSATGDTVAAAVSGTVLCAEGRRLSGRECRAGRDMRSFEEESACAGAKKAFTSSEELLCPKIRPGDSDTPNTATCKPTEQTIAARNPREIFPVEIGCGRIPGKRLDTGKFLEYQKTLANLMNNAGIWNRMTTDGMFGRMNG